MVLRKVLLIDDEQNILDSLRGVLEDEKFIVDTARNGAQGIQKLRKFQPDVVLLDIWMPGDDGLGVLEKIKKAFPKQVVIMMSGHGTVETAVKAIKLGAFDFIEKPIHFDKLLVLLQHAFEMRDLKEENQILRDAIQEDEELIGKSPLMVRLKQLIQVTAPSNGWVMIRGENGTGKELVARTLHRESPRSKHRFVAVNCAAIPDELIESELFGHEKGSFTGAHERKIGKFELANGGTLFLDEVGDMGHKMQAKILRALEECVIQRVGGQDNIELDLRVICATNKDLKKEIQLGNFREDLFYRLNVIPLFVPSLRERREDVPLLVQHFVNIFSAGKNIQLGSGAHRALMSYPWPGNVRELKNWVERACILSGGDVIDCSDLEGAELASEQDAFDNEDRTLREARANFEKQFILKVLAENGGNISKTALVIGVERSHLHKKIKSYGIEISDSGGTQ
ncbi:MAG: sigma-54-dependent Fis family transcriptional regulator [Proteobacteria bacterium]|nr:sigma-54-dependent Fis family transcriptional regulator [Pseudomonadota bacterium]NDC23733.1 sigma-54-dependent Fis family transcriptional regulator [Pseudomonadota bacterium]NDD03865.1 sigma-54-dependent Fis family transcriptional regulator [Pseudomonadota bacterium]NDG26439.1 sigma-54-dependent Fis family transcriptional regulator [Pseudomonadota bacterium]